MKKAPAPYKTGQIVSSIVMILSLVWLTVSLPFVYESQQQLSTTQQFAEEKAPTPVNEEYLHHETVLHPTFTSYTRKYGIHSQELYKAYHGELLSPPPEA